MGSLTAMAHRPWSKYLAWGPVMYYIYSAILKNFLIIFKVEGKNTLFGVIDIIESCAQTSEVTSS